ncbi:hypothetical protein MRX96_057025 [Rhipicephalus microplus]
MTAHQRRIEEILFEDKTKLSNGQRAPIITETNGMVNIRAEIPAQAELTDIEIQGISFDWRSGSECSDLESPNHDQAERTASQYRSGTDSSNFSDSDGLDVEDFTTVKNNIKKYLAFGKERP